MQICSTNRFILDEQYRDLLGVYGISVEEALRKAGLPRDVFSHKTPVMKKEEYFKFMKAAGSLVIDSEILIRLAYTERCEGQSYAGTIFAGTNQ